MQMACTFTSYLLYIRAVAHLVLLWKKISKQMKTAKLEDKGKIQHQRRIPSFTKQWKGKQAFWIIMCIKVSIYKNWLPWNSSKVKFLFKLSVLRWLYSMCIPHRTRVSQLKENPNTETQTSRSLVHFILKYCLLALKERLSPDSLRVQ